jgi:hypothetical protein
MLRTGCLQVIQSSEDFPAIFKDIKDVVHDIFHLHISTDRVASS